MTKYGKANEVYANYTRDALIAEVQKQGYRALQAEIDVEELKDTLRSILEIINNCGVKLHRGKK